jgi:hypothetical protein
VQRLRRISAAREKDEIVKHTRCRRYFYMPLKSAPATAAAKCLAFSPQFVSVRRIFVGVKQKLHF